MANSNRPHGFTPRSYLNGADWNGQARQYYVASTDTDAYYIGDAVVGADGASSGVIGGVISIGVPLVTKAVAGNPARGVLVGISPDITDLSLKYLPATKTKGYTILVVDDPALVFEIQGDNTTTLAATCVGQYADYIVAAPGSTMGESATVLATSTIAANAALPLRILGLAGGDFTAYTRFLVQWNLHEMG